MTTTQHISHIPVTLQDFKSSNSKTTGKANTLCLGHHRQTPQMLCSCEGADIICPLPLQEAALMSRWQRLREAFLPRLMWHLVTLLTWHCWLPAAARPGGPCQVRSPTDSDRLIFILTVSPRTPAAGFVHLPFDLLPSSMGKQGLVHGCLAGPP